MAGDRGPLPARALLWHPALLRVARPLLRGWPGCLHTHSQLCFLFQSPPDPCPPVRRHCFEGLGGGSFLKRQNLQTLTGVPHVLRNSFGLSWASPDSGNKPLRLGPTFPRTGRALLMGRVGRPWSDTQNSLRNANRMQPTVARFYDVLTHLRACRLPAEVQFPFRLRARMLLGLGRREPAEGNRAGECQAGWQRLGLARKLRPRPLRRQPQARSRFAAADTQPRTLSPVTLLLCWGNT